MMRMFTTTYGESEISMPNFDDVAAEGTHQNGITYIVRPRMQPSKTPARVRFISAGSAQLLVGPASSSFVEQM